jgi:hypothetical protein
MPIIDPSVMRAIVSNLLIPSSKLTSTDGKPWFLRSFERLNWSSTRRTVVARFLSKNEGGARRCSGTITEP